jgi:hypothetical protein
LRLGTGPIRGVATRSSSEHQNQPSDQALDKVMQFQGELRIELWCGSRKVADIPPTA